MDRVVLLAGGTLTLTFTALATISGHLEGAGRSAIHQSFVIAECWLLVVAIAFGLLYNRIVIVLRQKNDQTIVLAQVALFGRMKVLSLFPGADVSKLPSVDDDGPTQKQVKRLARLTTVASLTVHFCLTAAFICLAYFIQGNIGIILTVLSPGPHK